jgi:hypothetical protein
MKRIVHQAVSLAALTITLFVGLGSQAHAQQSVAEFLKPQTIQRPAIDNLSMKDGNFLVGVQRYCQQARDEQITCRYFIPQLTSGGGKMFGPWYIPAQSDPAPIGYKYQSSRFNLPMLDAGGNRVKATDWCYGDDNSPMQPCDPAVGCGKWRGGNPDTQWMGHKNGMDRGYAVCFIREVQGGVLWVYNLQGQEGGISGHFWPFAGNDALFSLDFRPDGHVLEPAELDVVYVKIPTAEQQLYQLK